ncbi:MAG TPA: hypothetical protein VKP08_05515, partial [Anaerolineales bacterium]|nr:hypothetical protein [Anaerolineales bacterium]
MKSRFALFLLFVLIATLLLSACGGAAAPATQAPSGPGYIEEPMEAATELPAATEAPAMEMPALDSGLSEQSAAEEKAVGGGQP